MVHMTETPFQLLLTIIFDITLVNLVDYGWCLVLIIAACTIQFSQMNTKWKEQHEGNCPCTLLGHSSQTPVIGSCSATHHGPPVHHSNCFRCLLADDRTCMWNIGNMFFALSAGCLGRSHTTTAGSSMTPLTGSRLLLTSIFCRLTAVLFLRVHAKRRPKQLNALQSLKSILPLQESEVAASNGVVRMSAGW